MGSISAPSVPAGSSRPASPPATRRPRTGAAPGPAARQGPGAGSAMARTSAHLNLDGAGEVVSGTGIAWGNGPDSATAYAGPSGEHELHHVPQPAWQRPVPHPQHAPGSRVTAGAAVPAAGRCSTSRPARRPARSHAQLHHHPDQRRRPARSPRPVITVGVRPPLATTSAGACRGTRRPGASNDAPNGLSASFTDPDLPRGASPATRATLRAGWEVETTDAIYKYRHTTSATSGTASRATCPTAPTPR